MTENSVNKRKKAIQGGLGLSLAVAAVLAMGAGAGAVRAGSITYEASLTQLDVEPAGSATENATEGYNPFAGVDGYSLFGISSTYTSLPGYVVTITNLVSSYGGNPSYANIDPPANPSGADIGTGAWYANGVAARGSADIFTFKLGPSNIPANLLVGFMVDNTDTTANNIVLSLGDSGSSASAALADGNRQPDWYYFDITGAAADTVYTVNMANADLANAYNLQIGGITFAQPAAPSAVSQPASMGLLGLGGLGCIGLGLISRRRMRL